MVTCIYMDSEKILHSFYRSLKWRWSFDGSLYLHSEPAPIIMVKITHPWYQFKLRPILWEKKKIIDFDSSMCSNMHLYSLVWEHFNHTLKSLVKCVVKCKWESFIVGAGIWEYYEKKYDSTRQVRILDSTGEVWFRWMKVRIWNADLTALGETLQSIERRKQKLRYTRKIDMFSRWYHYFFRRIFYISR